jgi:hypothetical protein
MLYNILSTVGQKRYVLVGFAGHEVGWRLLSFTSATQGIHVKDGKLFLGYMKVSLRYPQEL